ncbi:Asp/Glu/hydantoin racemase [Aureimonas endophytica]|uniref:Asp/Glu/hydantoin racemase n=1 Tax=Aureimonas endophytica TaxID=2027858 RepID=A0A916ZLR0_9HYPH|nr:aspartate/glutamate racemase family protein [Aureimonas endophytica]GGE03761.1 Asp/Glu/hydantoin racemase [Aureimonas endophytica]
MARTRPFRLGMLAPSSNTVLEPETQKLLPPDGSVTTHVSRLRVREISADAASRRQFDLSGMVEAAELLADAEVDLILWNGTAASWLGFDRDRAVIEAIEAATGIATTTAVVAINAELARLGARRIGLVTPYVGALEASIVENYAGIGIEVGAARRLDLTVNTDYAAIAPERLAAMTREVAAAGVEAVLILCTNLAGASIAPTLSRELGLPVLDSVRVAVEHSLARLPAGPRARA